MKIKQWLHIVRAYKAAYKFHQQYLIYNAEKAHFVGCQDWNIMEYVTSSHDSTLPLPLSIRAVKYPQCPQGTKPWWLQKNLASLFPCLSTHFCTSLSSVTL